MVRCDTAAGFAVTLNQEHGEESSEDLYQRQPGYAGLQNRYDMLRWSLFLTSEKIQISTA